MNWKKSIIFCVSFIVVFFAEIAINIACGPEADPYDYYVSFFHNNVQGDEFKPFAFNGVLFLNSEENVQDESQLNSAEWAKYLNVKQRDVHKVMYEVDSATSVKLAKFTGKSTLSLPDSLRKNTFLIGLTKNKKAFAYYQFTKKFEPMMVARGYWYELARDSATLVKGAATAEAFLAKNTDGFLKLRYAYQAQRMYRYAERFDESIRVYEKYIANNLSKTALNGWAMALYAGSLRRNGEGDRAAYFFSKVFASNPERRIMAYRNYFWTDAQIEDVLKFATNDNEKANIWAINGFRQSDSDIDHLKEVYNCDPNSPLVSALLIREVNKLEQNLLAQSVVSQDYIAALESRFDYESANADSIKKANLEHLKVVKTFVQQLSVDKRYHQTGFANITNAYLSWIEKNDLDANKYLAKVEFAKLSPKLKDQFRITELLVKANQIKKGASFNENELLPALKWLDEKRFLENPIQPNEKDWGYESKEGTLKFTITTRNFYQQILVPAYIKMGDTANAALAMLKGDVKYKSLKKNSFSEVMSYQSAIFWHQALSEKILENLAVLKRKKSAGLLQDFLVSSLNSLKNDDFYELLGTAYLRSHQYEKAVQAYNKLSKNFKFWTNNGYEWKNGKMIVVATYYANPFIETFKDYPKRYLNKSIGLNKKTFAQEMLRLQQLAISDPKHASTYYYKLANAIYQTGQFGNAWYFISYDSKVFDHPEFAYNYNSDYLFANQAKIWYQKAKAISKDQNFKAKCTYMIAKCETKRILKQYDAIEWDWNEDYEKRELDQKNKFKEMIITNPYFAELKQNYAGTPYYKTAVGECSYLRDFIAGKK